MCRTAITTHLHCQHTDIIFNPCHSTSRYLSYLAPACVPIEHKTHSLDPGLCARCLAAAPYASQDEQRRQRLEAAVARLMERRPLSSLSSRDTNANADADADVEYGLYAVCDLRLASAGVNAFARTNTTTSSLPTSFSADPDRSTGIPIIRSNLSAEDIAPRQTVLAGWAANRNSAAWERTQHRLPKWMPKSRSRSRSSSPEASTSGDSCAPTARGSACPCPCPCPSSPCAEDVETPASPTPYYIPVHVTNAPQSRSLRDRIAVQCTALRTRICALNELFNGGLDGLKTRLGRMAAVPGAKAKPQKRLTPQGMDVPVLPVLPALPVLPVLPKTRSTAAKEPKASAASLDPVEEEDREWMEVETGWYDDQDYTDLAQRGYSCLF